MVLDPGSPFGRYRILTRLGVGGMASVYHAFQAEPRREVALKIISPELAAQPTFRARFRREADVLAHLEHPNILPIYESGEVDGQLYICYRYIRGGTLKELLTQPLPVAQVLPLLAPVAAALDFAFGQGVIHRDIKPANILLTLPDAQGRRTPVIADFGIARLLESAFSGEDAAPRPDDGASLTQAGVGLGTPAYMAPEQVLGKPLDGRVDQYALAITAYQLLTGAVPFSATTPVEVAFMQVNAPLPLPGTRNPAVTPALEQVLLKALAKAPADRYPTSSAFIAALAAAAQDTATPAAPPARGADATPSAAAGTPSPAAAAQAQAPPQPAPVSARTSAPRGRRWPLLVAGGAAAVVLGAIALVAVRGSGGTGTNRTHGSPQRVGSRGQTAPSAVIPAAAGAPASVPVATGAAPRAAARAALLTPTPASAAAASPATSPTTARSAAVAAATATGLPGVLLGARLWPPAANASGVDLLAKDSGDPRVAFTVEAGAFVMRGQNLQMGTWATNVPGTYADVVLSLDVALQTSAADSGMTVRCRATNQGLSFYALRVLATGAVEIFRRDNQTTVVPLANAPDLPKVAPLRTDGSVNHVELACVGTTITAAINGVRVVLVHDDTYATGTLVLGLYGSGTLDGRFSNLAVTAATLTPPAR